MLTVGITGGSWLRVTGHRWLATDPEVTDGLATGRLRGFVGPPLVPAALVPVSLCWSVSRAEYIGLLIADWGMCVGLAWVG